MGYHTDFSGSFKLDKPLNLAQVAYLKQFAETRRMKRKASVCEKFNDPLRIAVELPLGVECGYFVGGQGFAGQDRDASIVDYNASPKGQPGLWCKWEPTEDGTAIEWNGAEKFYSYVEWLEYLIEHFLAPWGYKLTGEVEWFGEDNGDMGKIIVKKNKVTVKTARITYR